MLPSLLLRLFIAVIAVSEACTAIADLISSLIAVPSTVKMLASPLNISPMPSKLERELLPEYGIFMP